MTNQHLLSCGFPSQLPPPKKNKKNIYIIFDRVPDGLRDTLRDEVGGLEHPGIRNHHTIHSRTSINHLFRTITHFMPAPQSTIYSEQSHTSFPHLNQPFIQNNHTLHSRTSINHLIRTITHFMPAPQSSIQSEQSHNSNPHLNQSHNSFPHLNQEFISLIALDCKPFCA